MPQFASSFTASPLMSSRMLRIYYRIAVCLPNEMQFSFSRPEQCFNGAPAYFPLPPKMIFRHQFDRCRCVDESRCPRILHSAPCILQFCILHSAFSHPAFWILHIASCILHYCILHLASFHIIQYCISHSAFWTLNLHLAYCTFQNVRNFQLGCTIFL